MHLIHLLERVPPAFDGIGDFALILSRRLEEIGACSNALLPMRETGATENDRQLSDFTDYRTRIEAEINRHRSRHPGDRIALLLHFNRGGFHPHGLHFHLNSLLGSLKKSFGLPLFVFFHEFLPSRAPRRLHRWLRPVQVAAARRLIRAASHCFTNNEVYAKRIAGICPGATPEVAPIFSNIGEPDPSDTGGKEPGSWVIFGSADRARNSLRGLERMVKAGELALKPSVIRVVAGGRKMEALTAQVSKLSDLGVQVEVLPNLPAPEVSAVFQKSEFFFTDYLADMDEPWLDMLLKSGTFAAANSHGVITVTPKDGLGWMTASGHPGLVFLNQAEQGRDAAKLNPAALRTWYHNRCHSRNLAARMKAAMESF
ncbi:hypothetical protein JIN84_16025 [Luteolibacter yonseiensis]|uniref:Uncharacterized protein n=1 Tax=Luteolibacter yonseiensis TaxID=1144680 RepID=A0A934R2D3_9BACT|nr:hypothetical protein [Luteolibacter yonseiensis]MBK1817128.1 hypothetical protein [Luteolibacter yonseiensis]